MRKLFRVTTVPISLNILLDGQLKFMSSYFDVTAVSSSGKCFEEIKEKQGVNCVKIEMTRKITPFKDIIALLKFIEFFYKEKPYIVHTHTPKAGILGMLAAWITRVPNRLHTVAGMPLLVATGHKRELLNLVEKITYACATKVYPNSFVMKQIIIDNKLTKENKLKVIANGSSNGIDTSYFDRTEEVEKASLKLVKKNYFTFIFIGRVVKDKGINELVNAFNRLTAELNNIRLIIVGPMENDLDPILPKTKDLIKTNNNIEFMGYQEDVRPFFSASDALVFPSYREGFPNVVMQAGAMGLPSIVTDINGCNEIIIDGKNGIIIPPKDEKALYDAMKLFVTDKDMVLTMASKARKMIQDRYEQSMVWRAILKEYQSLLDK